MNHTPSNRSTAAAPGGIHSLVILRRLLLACALALSPLLITAPLHAQQSPPAEAVAAVNINRADAAALAAGLNGVGLARAEEIIRHREAYGPFASVEELAEVKGIGPATVERNRSIITLE